MSKGGSGSQKTTTQSSSNVQPWLQEPWKMYLGSLMSMIYPGMTIPGSWYMNKGETFPTGYPTNVPGGGGSGGNPSMGGPAGQAGGGQQPGGNAAQSVAQFAQQYGLDPSFAQSYLAPMIGGSPYLQNLARQNPGAVVGGASPAAANQLSQIYNIGAGGQGGGGGQ